MALALLEMRLGRLARKELSCRGCLCAGQKYIIMQARLNGSPAAAVLASVSHGMGRLERKEL